MITNRYHEKLHSDVESENPLPLPFPLNWQSCPKCGSRTSEILGTQRCPKCGTHRVMVLPYEKMPMNAGLKGKDRKEYTMVEETCFHCGEVFNKQKGSARILCTTCNNGVVWEDYKKGSLYYPVKAYKAYVCAVCNKEIKSKEKHFIKFSGNGTRHTRWHLDCQNPFEEAKND